MNIIEGDIPFSATGTAKMEIGRLQGMSAPGSGAAATKKEQAAALKLEKKAQKQAVKVAKQLAKEEKKRSSSPRRAVRGNTDLL